MQYIHMPFWAHHWNQASHTFELAQLNLLYDCCKFPDSLVVLNPCPWPSKLTPLGTIAPLHLGPRQGVQKPQSHADQLLPAQHDFFIKPPNSYTPVGGDLSAGLHCRFIGNRHSPCFMHYYVSYSKCVCVSHMSILCLCSCSPIWS